MPPELTQDFHERIRFNGYRFSFAVVGRRLGAEAGLPLINSFFNKSLGYSVAGALPGLMMMVPVLITTLTVRESETRQVVSSAGFWETYLKVFRNKPFVFILLTYTPHPDALTIASGIAIYYFKYCHHDESINLFSIAAS